MDTRPARSAPIPTERRAGLILVALGALALLANAGWLGGADGLIGGLLFAVVGAAFLRGYRRDREDAQAVWRLPVGFGAFGLAAAAVTSGELSGAWFLGFVALGFALVYLDRRERWWALIPAGAVATLALVASLEALPLPTGGAEGPVFFLGLAATFGLVLRSGRRWALWPALAAAALAATTLLAGGGWLLPLVLVGAGAWLLRRDGAPFLGDLLAGRPAHRSEPAASPAPSPAPEPAPAADPAPAAVPADGAADPAADPVEDPRPGSA